MTNTALEAMYAGSALETYLECVEHLPNDVQRYVTELRDLDMKSNELLNEVERLKEAYKNEKDAEKKKNTVALIRKFLIKNQENGDSKLRTVARIQDMIEVKARQLDLDFENLEPSGATVNVVREEESHAQAKSVSNADTSVVASSSSSRLSKSEDKFEVPKGKRPRQRRRHQDPVPKDEEKKQEEEKPRKKKAKREKTNERSPNNKVSVAPDEPVYCLCKQLSYGEMILCDNMQCAIQWFHFDCVNVQQNPKGKWFCPNCRGDRSNVMKPGLVEQIRREKQSRKNTD